ncbi:MAG: helix-turn-helix domain-containing protein [Nocardiaceae bacterium]|nr:helix-turn-helix domain-containing protein [Nocardiaceae bacterium]
MRREKRLSAAARVVASELGDTANCQGFGAWKSNEQLCEALGFTRRTVQMARSQIVELGYLIPVKHINGGRSKTIHYNLEMP